MSKENGTPDLNFSSGPAAINQEDYPTTRKEVSQYVANAFTQWHKPTQLQANKTDAILDIWFLYGKEVGFEVRDGRAYMDAEAIIKWAHEKQAKDAEQSVIETKSAEDIKLGLES